MATVKLILRTSSLKENQGTLYFRIIHRRKVRQIHTGYKVTTGEWDSESGAVIVAGAAQSRRDYLLAVAAKVAAGRRRLECIIAGLDRRGGDYPADEIVERYMAPDAVVGFLSFGRGLIRECERIGRASAAGHYSSALNSFVRFYGNEDVPFSEFDAPLVAAYECYLKAEGLCPNTTSYYMRKLRAIYNRAVDRNLTVQHNPFKHVYTGVARTVKRAVTLEVIKSLRALDLRLMPMEELARDMFLFSFYTRGMSIVDMSYLRKKNLQNGMLTYRRRKTSRQLTIKWESPMEDIVRRHMVEGSDYMLPLIKPNGKDERRQYLNATHLINRHLKKLGRKLGLPEPLTMYVARHAWASIARENDIPISLISQGMGHDSESTTRIYLASFSNARLDRANHDIIRLLDD